MTTTSQATSAPTLHPLWVLLADEHERDGYALKPAPWEGPGEYQRVTYEGGDSLGVLVKVSTLRKAGHSS